MKRLVEFVDRHRVAVELAYLPPYHSKYNPIHGERTSIRENRIIVEGDNRYSNPLFCVCI
jgi:hypothetical protein